MDAIDYTPPTQAEREYIDWVMRRHEAIRNCPNCNQTAKAIAHVQAQWVVAGIDKDE